MHKRHTFHILIALMVFGVTGCTEDEQFLEDNISVDVEEQPANSDAPQQEASNLAPNDATLFRMGDWSVVEQLVKANSGKVVVIDIWSTYCAPCMQEFPRLIELQEKHGDAIKCVSFNINYAGLPDQTPESDIEFIEPFLKKHGDSVEHLVSTVTDESIYEKLGIYAIPAVLIYDMEGKLVHKVLEENAYESTVSPSVSKMLNPTNDQGESNES